MRTFLKAQAASLIATIVDFAVTMLLVGALGLQDDVRVTAAAATGTITGGIVNFLLGREWVFIATHQTRSIQAGRYFLVWTGNLLLNAGFVYLLIHFDAIQVFYAKVIVSILIGFSYNYFLQKKYVFR
ncbi:MAG: GtrA family protein [Bacteroidetes bacterium]|nr:GtrA family protein [Bacteroidota bacterium]